jgi:glucose-1-phosphate thymidylyltransferase
VKIVVLAAGYATRLGLQTLHTPKPLLDLGGTPLLTRLIDRLRTAGKDRAPGDPEAVSEVVVVTNARFAEPFRAWRAALRGSVPVRILDDGTRRAEDRLGAIGDLAFAFEQTPCQGEDWLVSAGDMWIDADLAPAAEAFRHSGAGPGDRVSRLLVRRVPSPARGGAQRSASPSPYNEVTLDGESVVAFREKPEAPATDRAAIALYFFPHRIAEHVREYLAGGGNPDAPGHFIAWLVGRELVEASPLAGEWNDIGSPEALRAARARFAHGGSHQGQGPTALYPARARRR